MAYQKDNHLVNDIEVELARQQIRHDDTTTAMLKKLISAALYLFVNEVPHTTQWAELLSLLALVAPEVKAWLCGRPGNAHYMSPTAVTQLLNCTGTVVQTNTYNKVIKSVATYGAFSYMGNETMGITNHQFAVHCVRFLDESGHPVEAFVGSSELNQTSAAAIKLHVDSLFKRMAVDVNKMASCSFDGGANYARCKAGVQALLRKSNTSLFYVHCRAHLLQLALIHVSQKYLKIKRAVYIVNSLYTYFSRHPQKQRQ